MSCRHIGETDIFVLKTSSEDEDVSKMSSRSLPQVECLLGTQGLVQMLEFVLKNNYFAFNGQVKHQISGTVIVTKCAPPQACIFMEEVEKGSLMTQQYQPLVWYQHIDDIFCIQTHRETTLKGDLRPTRSPCFYGIFFDNLMKKESCTKFCGILIRFHEVIKLQSY